MSDTPETDAEKFFSDHHGYCVVFAEHAEDLERERDELRKALSLAGKLCHEVHHPKSMQHGNLDPCPVEALIQQALYKTL